MTRQRALTSRDDVGAWVVKANPDQVWSYLDAIESLPRGTVSQRGWTLGKTYRNEMIAKGDLVALWVTGRHQPGIYEIGVVDGKVGRGFIDDEFLIDTSRSGEEVDIVPFTSVLMRSRIARQELQGDPVLRRCEQLRASKMSNPTYLTKGELAALTRLINDQDLSEAGWSARLPSRQA